NGPGDGNGVFQQRFKLENVPAPEQPNTPPSGLVLSATAVLELAGQGAEIGVLSAADPDAGDTLTFALLDDAGGRFDIVGGNKLVVKDGFKLDFEQGSSHVVRVKATDSKGAGVEADLAIQVVDWRGEFTAGSFASDVF